VEVGFLGVVLDVAAGVLEAVRVAGRDGDVAGEAVLAVPVGQFLFPRRGAFGLAAPPCGGQEPMRRRSSSSAWSWVRAASTWRTASEGAIGSAITATARAAVVLSRKLDKKRGGTGMRGHSSTQ